MSKKLITLWLLFFTWLFFGARPAEASSVLPPDLPAVGACTIEADLPAPPSCPLKSHGDADCNNQINILDFGYWRIEFLKAINNEAPPAGGWKSDFDDDGSPTIVDFGRWRKYFLESLR